MTTKAVATVPVTPTTVPSTVTPMRIDYISLDELQRWPRNPKDHATDKISKSIERFGYVQPVIVDENTGQLVAGHGRLEAMQKMQASGAAVPARVQLDKDGRWMIPVFRGVRFNTNDEAEAYLLADNKLVELGGWNEELLGSILKDLDKSNAGLVDLAGFSDDAFRAAVASLDDVGEFGKPDMGNIIDTIAPIAQSRKPDGDGFWFYIEYYGASDRFNRLREHLKPVMKTDHEIDPAKFEEMVMQYLPTIPAPSTET